MLPVTNLPEHEGVVKNGDMDQPDLQRLARGDPQAFAALVDRHQQMLLALVQSMGFSGADREDAMAEIFAQVYLALPKFEGRSRLSTWIYRIAVRTLIKQRARRDRNRTLAPSELTEDSRQALPHQRLQTIELQAKLWSAVASLDPRSAAAVELHYRQNWPLEEIAAALDCSVGAAKTILFRAREQLRLKLKPEQFE